MIFTRRNRSLPTLCLAFLFVLFIALAPLSSSGQSAPPSPSQPQTALPTATAANPQQAYSLPPDKLAKAIELSHMRQILSLVESLWSLAVLWLLLATRAAARLAASIERRLKQRWLQGLLFFILLIVLVSLADLPLAWYGHRLGIRFGISVQSWTSWLTDQAKMLGLSLLLFAPVLLLFNWIVRRWPRRYWLVGWSVSLFLILFGTLCSPFLEPIFNKFEPLTQNHPALVAKLEQVVARTGTTIPPQRFFLMKASEKSNGLNAYVSGIGATKRIVVWDTTAGRIPDDEVLFIFGHESGHYVLNHIPKEMAGSAVFLIFFFWACAKIAAALLRRFGARWQIAGIDTPGSQDGSNPLSTRAGFVVLIFVISVGSFLQQPISNTFSRHFEHEADIYGQESIHGLVANPQKTAVSAFNHIGEAWLEDPNPSPFVEFWTYSHPSVQHRANFALHYNPWANGGHGSFFAH